MVRARIEGMLGAPRSRSAHARRSLGGAWRLQAPTPAGVAAPSAGLPASRRSTTSASRASMARGAPWSRRWLTSSSRAASSTTGSRGFAATPVRTNTCSRFSCKGRYFCPSCHAKRLAIWTQWLDTTLLALVPHRQVVLTIPKRLRAYCLYRRRLLGEIACVAARTVTAAIRSLTGERDLAVGIVACLQTHGSRANWHPRLYLLVTDGGFYAGSREPGHGTRPMPVRPRSAGHLRTAPTPRHHEGTFGVGGGPTGATDWPPPASLPHGDRRSHGPQGARTSRRARRRRPVGARAASDRVVYSTDSRSAPIEIPIPLNRDRHA